MDESRDIQQPDGDAGQNIPHAALPPFKTELDEPLPTATWPWRTALLLLAGGLVLGTACGWWFRIGPWDDFVDAVAAKDTVKEQFYEGRALLIADVSLLADDIESFARFIERQGLEESVEDTNRFGTQRPWRTVVRRYRPWVTDVFGEAMPGWSAFAWDLRIFAYQCRYDENVPYWKMGERCGEFYEELQKIKEDEKSRRPEMKGFWYLDDIRKKVDTIEGHIIACRDMLRSIGFKISR